MSVLQVTLTFWTMLFGGWLAHYNLEFWLKEERKKRDKIERLKKYKELAVFTNHVEVELEVRWIIIIILASTSA